MSTLSRRRPWLMFNAPEATGGNVDPSTLSDEDFLAQIGFPRNTAEKDMTPEQGRAYWRHESKKQQKDREARDRELAQWKGLGEYEAVTSTVQGAEAARQAALTEAQRAQEAADRAAADARAAGEASAASMYLGDAIAGQIVALTIKPGEKPEDAQARVKAALQFVEPTRFLNAEKGIDPALVAQFAASVAPTAVDANAGDPNVLSTLYGNQSAPPQGSGGSIAEARQATRERLGKKQK